MVRVAPAAIRASGNSSRAVSARMRAMCAERLVERRYLTCGSKTSANDSATEMGGMSMGCSFGRVHAVLRAWAVAGPMQAMRAFTERELNSGECRANTVAALALVKRSQSKVSSVATTASSAWNVEGGAISMVGMIKGRAPSRSNSENRRDAWERVRVRRILRSLRIACICLNIVRSQQHDVLCWTSASQPE